MSAISNEWVYRHREQACGCQGEVGSGELSIESLGLADANYNT